MLNRIYLLVLNYYWYVVCDKTLRAGRYTYYTYLKKKGENSENTIGEKKKGKHCVHREEI